MIFSFAPSLLLWTRLWKTSDWNLLPVSLWVVKHVKNNFVFSDLSLREFWWFNTKWFLSYSKNFICEIMQTNLRSHNYSSLIFLFESRKSASVFNFPWKNQCNSIESKNTHSEDDNWILRNQYMEKQVATHRLQNINSWNIIAFPEKKIQTETTENRFEKTEPVVLITTTTPNSSKNSTSVSA